MVKLVSKGEDDLSGHMVARRAGEILFKEGDQGSELFIVQEGQVELLKGEPAAPFALLERGDVFGELAVLEERKRETGARAVTDCKLLRIDAPTFDEMVRKSPEVAVRMMWRVARRAAALAEAAAPGGPAAQAAGKGQLRPRLVHAPGVEFPLAADAETVVGRPDRSSQVLPDIDLAHLDTQRSLSRRHARILRDGSAFSIQEEAGVRNGTFLNGQQLPAGKWVPIKDGDEISFGLIKTTFRTGA